MGINVLSLFDGISCGQVALERAGIKVDKYFASEIDKYSIQVTQKNYPNTIQLGDVTKIKLKDLPKIDLIIGGTPCQDLSSFKQNAKGLKGDKSILFFEFIRVLKELKPKYFLLENIKMKKEWRDTITNEIGNKPIEINSSDFSAQNRTRLYWTNIPQSIWTIDNIKFKDILENLPFRKIPGCFFKNWGDKQRIDKGINWVKNEKGNCVTTKNCHTNQYLLNESLQTLPKDYTKGIINMERFKAIGNGWTVDVIAHIFKQLKNTTCCD